MQSGHPGKSTGSSDHLNFNQPTKAWVFEKRTKSLYRTDIRTGGHRARCRTREVQASLGSVWKAARRFFAASPLFHRARAIPIQSSSLDRDLKRRLGVRRGPFQQPHPGIYSGWYVCQRSVHRSRNTNSYRHGHGHSLIAGRSATDFSYVSGGDQHIRILNRQTLEVVTTIGRLGHYPGQFYHLHVIAVDSKGNIYTGESNGRRVQKFIFRIFSSRRSEAKAIGIAARRDLAKRRRQNQWDPSHRHRSPRILKTAVTAAATAASASSIHGTTLGNAATPAPVAGQILATDRPDRISWWMF